MRFKHFAKTLDHDTSKKEEILNAAQKVFAEVGYKEATIRSICKEARANVCLVSYYFGGKEGLYRSLFEHFYKDYTENFLKFIEVDENINTTEEYKIRLLVYIKNIYSQMRDHSDFVTLVQRELVEGIERGTDYAHKFVRQSQLNLSTFIIYGQKKKFVKKELDPRLCCGILMTLISGFVQHEKTGHFKVLFPDIPAKEIPEQVIKSISTIFFNGVLQ